jgi:hypothetical protein
MKKLLLEFYRELLPVFEKYEARIRSKSAGLHSTLMIVKASEDSSKFAVGEMVPFEWEETYADEDIDIEYLLNKIKELEDEETTTD